MFAKWWSLQPVERRFSSIDRAINARFIMNNDLSRIGPETPRDVLPDCICYPSLSHEATFRELFRRAPSMKQAIASVCILADHDDVWDLLDADPEESFLQDARASPDPKYLRDLES